MSSLTVLCPNAKRCKIPVKPMTQLGEVLEEACLSQGYDVDLYDLQHHSKIVDETLTFRLSGLPNNANLELVSSKRKAVVDVVEIALQTPDGRKTRIFQNTCTLADVLNGFAEEFGRNLMDLNEGEIPVITYLSKQWKTKSVLATAKLRSMGLYSGRAMLRYSAEKLSPEEQQQLAQVLDEADKKRKALFEKSEAMKAAHLAREKMEQSYHKDLELRMEAERFKQEEDSRKLAEELALKEEEMKRSREAESKMEVEESAQPGSSTSATRQPSQTTMSDLERLEATLRVLNSSLQTGRSDSLVDQLLTESGTLRSDVDMEDLTAASRRPLQPQVDFSNFKFPDKKIEVSYDTGDDKIVEEINVDPPESRQVVLFDRTLSEEKRKELDEEVDDAVYETTLKDIKVLQKQLSEQVKGQRALVPKRFIDAKNKERKNAAYKHTVIRFLLPENKTIQACFYSKEAVSQVYEFIDSILASADVKYDLVFFLKEMLAKDSFKNLIDAGLAPKSNLILRFKPNPVDNGLGHYFKTGVYQLISLEEADEVSRNWLTVNSKFEPYNPTIGPESQTSQLKRAAESSALDEAGPAPVRRNIEGVPKWLKK